MSETLERYEIWSREGPGDSFRHVMNVDAFGNREALDVYAEHAGGKLAHKYFLVRVKDGGAFKLWRIVDKPSFMEI